MKNIIHTALLVLFLLSSGWISGKPAEKLPPFRQPLLISSAGQSAEVQSALILAKRAGLKASLIKSAVKKDLNGFETLALVAGASMKGLGAAGLDITDEKERVRRLVDAAGKKEVPILFLHLGGEARRGTLTDDFIKEFVSCAAFVLVVKSGNKDGIFTEICRKKNIPLVEVERTVDAVAPLKQCFSGN
ncbi:MAG: hypothetical protein JXB26_11180 [Candidatus Aminicenantes bacterium]|nr:hypothetical protein [Candidatus Aminicenantes bacterium]